MFRLKFAPIMRRWRNSKLSIGIQWHYAFIIWLHSVAAIASIYVSTWNAWTKFRRKREKIGLEYFHFHLLGRKPSKKNKCGTRNISVEYFSSRLFGGNKFILFVGHKKASLHLKQNNFSCREFVTTKRRRKIIRSSAQIRQEGEGERKKRNVVYCVYYDSKEMRSYAPAKVVWWFIGLLVIFLCRSHVCESWKFI